MNKSLDENPFSYQSCAFIEFQKFEYRILYSNSMVLYV